MDKVRLLQGDCKDLFCKVEDNSVDLIITDPPYGVEFSKGFDDSLSYVKENIRFWISEMYRVLKPNCHCYIFIPTKEAGMWITEIERLFDFNNILSTRTFTSSVYLNNNYQYNTQLIVYCSKGKAKRLNAFDFFLTSQDWLNDKRNKNPHLYTYSYPSFISEVFGNVKLTKENSSTRHPCEKNPDLIRLFVGVSSNKDDVVFDCFMGSGVTGLVAFDMDRKFIGFEKNEEYFERLDEKFANATVWSGTKIQYE